MTTPRREGTPLDAQVACDLLARALWMLDNDPDDTSWDDDALLTDTYEEYEARAFDAIRKATSRV